MGSDATYTVLTQKQRQYRSREGQGGQREARVHGTAGPAQAGGGIIFGAVQGVPVFASQRRLPEWGAGERDGAGRGVRLEGSECESGQGEGREGNERGETCNH